MSKKDPFIQVRIDKDLYDFFVEYAASQEDYISATQMINNMLRQSVRAAGIALDDSKTIYSTEDDDII